MVFGRKKSASHGTAGRLPSELVKSRPKKPAPQGCNPYDSTGRVAKRRPGVAKARPTPKPKPEVEHDPSNPYDTASRYPAKKKGWAGARSGAFDKD